MDESQINIQVQKMSEILHKVQNNPEIYNNDVKFKNNIIMIRYASELQDKVREYKIKKSPLTVDIDVLRRQFLNHERFKILAKESPSLFEAAIYEQLGVGELKKILDQIAKCDGDPKKFGNVLKNYVEKIGEDINSGVKKYESKHVQVFPDETKNEENNEEKISDDEDEEINSEMNQFFEEKRKEEQNKIQELIEQFKKNNKQ